MIPLLLVVVFAFLSLLHLYWAFGGTWGGALALPMEDGRPVFEPGVGATLAVAVALALCALLVARLAGWLSLGLRDRVARLPGYALAAVLLLRAIGDFRYIGFFKRIGDTPFGRRDTALYSPLCLLLALGVFLLVRWNLAREQRRGAGPR